MEWVASPWTFATVFTFIAGVIVLTLLGVRLRIGEGGIATSKAEDKKEPLLPEKYAREALNLAQKTFDHAEKMHSLRASTIAEQMKIYEEIEISVVGSLKTTFRSILDKLEVPVAEKRSEAMAFSNLLAMVSIDIKNKVRAFFLNNHYHTYSEVDFDLYVEQKKRTIVELVSTGFDLYWISSLVTREDFRLVPTTQWNEIIDLVERCFKQARIISMEKQEQLDAERKSYNAYVLEVTGSDPSQAC